MENTMSILDHMTTAEYMSSQRGPMGSIGHFWAMVWRNSLLADGKYIKTSEQRRAGRRKSRIAPVEWFVRKPGAELVNYSTAEARRIIRAKALAEMDDE